jgi:N-acetylglucosamine malate deacetylase 1
MKKILVISAHPDDESLGLGGTLALHAKNGDEVFVLIFTDGESSRGKKENQITKREEQSKRACKILGIKKVKFLRYLDQNLESISLVEIANEIEDVIKNWSPSIIYTHYWGDMNQDHRRLFEATKIATRPIPNSSIKRVLCYETPSSTEWGKNTEAFNPNHFVNISSTLKIKLKAIKQYKNEIKKFPHPRSIEGISVRSKFWGSCTGLENAEAFIILQNIEK